MQILKRKNLIFFEKLFLQLYEVFCNFMKFSENGKCSAMKCYLTGEVHTHEVYTHTRTRTHIVDFIPIVVVVGIVVEVHRRRSASL